MNTFRRTLTATAACFVAAAAQAEIIDIAWSASGSFERSLVVEPGQFAEVCGALKAGDTVQWRFDAAQALNFNIHFHEGQAVRYPARADKVRDHQGTLAAESAQDYCWMWSNKGAVASALQIRLQKP